MTPQEFELAFPKVMGWIQKTLLAHQKLARPVTSKNFQRLPLYFSRAQIGAAKFVVVDRLPVPPLSSFGLSLALYANGLEAFGYRNSPLEKMAYDAQELFDRSAAVFDAEKLVTEKLEAYQYRDCCDSERDAPR